MGSSDGFGLAFMTNEETPLHSSCVSDGVILTLALITIAVNPDKPTVLLLEEPENGVHYQSLKETVEMLRSLPEDHGVQVILTTHSPYLLDLVEPEEVKVFHKNEDGSVQARGLDQFPETERLREHFGTGEIWTEFDESEIVQAKDQAEAGA